MSLLNLLQSILILAQATSPTCAAPASPEDRIVAEATGNLLCGTAGTKFEPACEQEIDYEADVIDLNEDGQPEVLISIHGACLGGAAGVHVNLFIRDADGSWQPQFGFPGIATILETRHLGFPDIEIGGPGFCFPVWRWDGRSYALHKSCPR